MITIPEEATPADVVGDTDILAGQDWLSRPKLIYYANWLLRGGFPWLEMNEDEPMRFELASNGKVITQGHHRWLAARLAGVEIPVKIEVSRSYWPGPVPFAVAWQNVVWEDEPYDPLPFRR